MLPVRTVYVVRDRGPVRPAAGARPPGARRRASASRGRFRQPFFLAAVPLYDALITRTVISRLSDFSPHAQGIYTHARMHNEDHKDTPTPHAHAVRNLNRHGATDARSVQARASKERAGVKWGAGRRHAAESARQRLGQKHHANALNAASKADALLHLPPLARRTRSEAAQKMPVPRALFLAASRAAHASL